MSTLATDNFNRADGGLGANWTTLSGRSAPLIATNQCTENAGGGTTGVYTGVSFPNDQWSQCTWTGTVAFGGAPGVRGSNSVQNMYWFEFTGTGSARSFQLFKDVGGGFSTLSSGTQTVAQNDVFYIEIQGTNLLIKQNGVHFVAMDASDNAIASGFPGVALQGVSGVTIDDWSGGDFAAGGAPTGWPAPDSQMQSGMMVGWIYV